MGRYPAPRRRSSSRARTTWRIARDALAATGTLALADRPFPTLSGGEKQRVIIAGALAQAADLMLLDEPTAALDPGYQIEIAALLRRLNAERGVTIVVATHDLNFAAGLCRHLLLLREGRVLAAGPTAEVLTRESVRALYDVEADVHVPRRRGPPHGGAAAPGQGAGVATCHCDAAFSSPSLVFGLMAVAALRARAAGRVGPDLAAARLRPQRAVRRQHRRADPLRVAAAAHARRRPGRRHARRGGRRLPGAAPQPARHALHARRVGRRRARRHARHHAPGVARVRRRRRGPDRQLRRRARRGGDRLRPLHDQAPRAVDERAAAGRHHAQRLLLGPDPLRPVHGRLLADDEDGAVADGGPGRRELRADRGGAAVHAAGVRASSRGSRGR